MEVSHNHRENRKPTILLGHEFFTVGALMLLFHSNPYDVPDPFHIYQQSPAYQVPANFRNVSHSIPKPY